MPRHSRLVLLSMSVLLRALVAAQEPSYTFTIIDPPDAISTSPIGINARGQIIGQYTDATRQTHGFLFEKGTFTPLDVPDATLTTAEGISARGQIIGQYRDAGGRLHGFLYER